ncbi:hypothetical protein [Flagellimonas sp. CMM7]|uniref:hypothetical protein n=1 Tax=Flagellimonas sp. CMM7 TaxID=2654676 RepID=UPI001969E2EE|nr:hypothetical protein [Flagellimonas sp. CMM7]UII80033.1 hypothetical protein LV704_00580 [Flagellimonas sp. CMM7]
MNLTMAQGSNVKRVEAVKNQTKDSMEEQLNSKMVIEKGIELRPAEKLKPLCKYPWRGMKVGDSFIWPKNYTRMEMNKASNAGRNFCKGSKDCKDWKFSTRKVDGNKIRIWRIR